MEDRWSSRLEEVDRPTRAVQTTAPRACSFTALGFPLISLHAARRSRALCLTSRVGHSCMSADPKSERPSATTPVWLQILRPVLILVCCVLGFVAFDRIVIRGTVFDGKTTPKWSGDGLDLSTARDAMRRADFEEASRILKQLLLKEPNHGEAHQLLGRIYLQTGDRQRALEHYEMGSRYLPGDRESERALEILRALGQQDGPANGSQPIRSVTNRTSSTAGSRR
jgi:tetratricopeptide (TPR) repeat protein